MLGKSSNKSINAFFALVRAGLWEKSVQLLPYGEIDFEDIERFSEEQSVVGLVAAGFEHVDDIKFDKKDLLQFIGQTLQLEQKNQAMNYFIGVLVDKMREDGINTILVKGQGVAQCYARPLWRSCGDVDFFLSDEYYEKAKKYLTPLANTIEDEHIRERHIGMTIDPWVVELHGRLYSGLSPYIERELDDVYQDSFFRGSVRYWMNDDSQVFLLSVENDVFYVFTHILQHFYKGGIGLRQICDWCRLLWTYKGVFNLSKLEKRLARAKLLTEWKAFGAFAVEYLGMPIDALPLYSSDDKWKRKANKIFEFVVEVGNLGHNRDTSYYNKYSYLIRKGVSLVQRCGDLIRHGRIFPMNTLRFFPKIIRDGLQSAIRGE